MVELLTKIFAQYGLTGLVAWAVRYLRHVTRETFSFVGLLKSLMSLFFVLVVVGMSVIEYELMPPNMKIVFIAVTCFIADDVLAGVAVLGRMLGSDPVGLAGRVWAIIRGGKIG